MSAADEPWWVTDRAAQFRQFADSDGLTAPLYATLTRSAAQDQEVLALLDAAPVSQQRAVLMLAAVHYLVLGDPGCDLARFYPSVDPDRASEVGQAEDPWPVFRSFCLDRRAELSEIIATRNTQTNEVGRCAALLPALQWVHRETGGSLSLLEVGASAGLNLVFDRYRIEYSTPSWEIPDHGFDRFETHAGVGPVDSAVLIRSAVVGDRTLPPDLSPPAIADRVGLDIFPGDVHDPESVRWLEACIFADRVDRLSRLRAAVATAATAPPRVERGDAVADLSRVAATVQGDGPLVVFHSWALTYVDDATGFAREVSALAADRDLWWVAIEPSSAVPDLVVPPRDDRYSPSMAANTVTSVMHVRPDGREDRVLARSHPHLDWIHWLA